MGNDRVYSRSCTAWDVMGFRAGGGGSKYAVDSDTVRRLLTSRIPKPTNHDRIEGRFEVKMGKAGVKEERSLENVTTSISNSSPISLLSGIGAPGKSASMDEEIINFPSYEECESAGVPEQSRRLKVNSIDIIDDTFLQHRPTIHVDYLSHDWLEEDIWASWRHLTARRNVYTNGPRLENASWRSWGKKKAALRTIPPENIEWTKDLDVTWLYGPLQTGGNQSTEATPLPSRMSDSGIDLGLTKPILKTSSLAELLLQNSLPDLSISRQSSPSNDTAPSRSPSMKSLQKASTVPQVATCQAFSTREKNVRFHEEVAQCISITQSSHDFDEGDITCHFVSDDYDAIDIVREDSPRSSTSDSVKTIELLPPTCLKPEWKPKPEPVQRSNSWPCRSPSFSWNENLLPPPSTRIMDDNDVDWISPIPKEPCKTQSLEKLPKMTDDELFEIEMFGSIQHGPHVMNSSFTHPIETHTTDSSPTISEYLSSCSSDQDQDEEDDFALPFQIQPETESTPSPPLSASQRPVPKRSMSSNDLPSSSNFRYGVPAFSFSSTKDQAGYSASLQSPPPFQTQSNFSTQHPKPSAVIHAAHYEPSSLDDDEDHWWMNV
jgi:hypothetical protein